MNTLKYMEAVSTWPLGPNPLLKDLAFDPIHDAVQNDPLY